MTRRLRVAVAGLLAALLAGGLVALVVASFGRGGPEDGQASIRVQERKEETPRRVAAQPPEGPLTNEELPVSKNGADEPAEESSPEEQPIEEMLAASGEDPGAVFYMSRVREAIREGNPAFARELFQHMRREHKDSILVLEAERLLE